MSRVSNGLQGFLSLVLVLLIPELGYSASQQSCPDGQRKPGTFIVRFRDGDTEYSGKNASPNVVFQSLSTRLSKATNARFDWIYQRDYSINHDADTKSGSLGYPSSTFRKAVNSSFRPASVAVANLSDDDLITLSKMSEVLSIEPDCRVRLNALPNDPGVPSMWSRSVLNLDEAWDLIHDASDVLVAVSDTGVEYRHEDLAANMWRNEAELQGEIDIDDDGNGCIDDYYGCDLADQDGDPIPNATVIGSHGTHVAGIIGAFGNNGAGVSGMAWRVKILAAKGFSSLDDSASMSDLLRSVYYSVNQGAKIINCSWGIGRTPTQAETDAFRYAIAQGALPVVAAGNEGLDASAMSPASIPGVLTVGSVNSRLGMSAFSNFGSVVSVFAPGGESISKGGPFDEFIQSTVPDLRGTYGDMRGTSMSTPHVSGIAALMLAANPSLLPADLIRILKSSSRPVRTMTPSGIKTEILVVDAKQAVLEALNTRAPADSPPSQHSTFECERDTECSASLPSIGEPAPSLETTANASGGCSITPNHEPRIQRQTLGIGALIGDSLIGIGSIIGVLLCAIPSLLAIWLRRED